MDNARVLRRAGTCVLAGYRKAFKDCTIGRFCARDFLPFLRKGCSDASVCCFTALCWERFFGVRAGSGRRCFDHNMKDLAPGGKLRAAINHGNSVLAQTDAASGQPKGVTPDLARELGTPAGRSRSSSSIFRRGRQSVRSGQERSVGYCTSSRSTVAPPRSSSPRPMSSSRALTWCQRIHR